MCARFGCCRLTVEYSSALAARQAFQVQGVEAGHESAHRSFPGWRAVYRASGQALQRRILLQVDASPPIHRIPSPDHPGPPPHCASQPAPARAWPADSPASAARSPPPPAAPRRKCRTAARHSPPVRRCRGSCHAPRTAHACRAPRAGRSGLSHPAPSPRSRRDTPPDTQAAQPGRRCPPPRQSPCHAPARRRSRIPALRCAAPRC